MPRSTQVPAMSFSGSGTGLSPALAELSSSLPLPTPESFMPALQPRMVETIRFRLFPVRSPLLRESRLISFPPGTEMFHFPGLASCILWIQMRMTGHDSRRVSPFRHHRIKGCLAPPRCLSQLTTSFFASWRQGIHLLPFLSCLLRTFFLSPIQLLKSRPTCGPPSSDSVRSRKLLPDAAKAELLIRDWWSWTESNRRPSACKADALPTELQPRPIWWAWKDLNYRPHAYQACALAT